MTLDSASVSVRINGHEKSVPCRAQETLLETLRFRENVSSVRGACHIGLCGTCTVLVDGKATSSCLALTAALEGSEIWTLPDVSEVESEAAEIVAAFVENGSYQCSYCIPGMVVAVVEAMSEADKVPSVESVLEHLDGNLCRCGSYASVLRAVRDVVAARSGSGSAEIDQGGGSK